MAVGIVCEWNPFHNGHAYLLAEVKRRWKAPVVCAMSGNFVQRGELACFRKERRAQWAIEGGADVVLENPFPFSCATAERFACSAVKLLADSGLCDALAFGCEGGSAAEYMTLAAFLAEPAVEQKIRERVCREKKVSYASVREETVKETLGESYAGLLRTPNAILGVAYAGAILKGNYSMELLPVPRAGVSHDGGFSGSYASASFLREFPTEEHLKRFCPPFVSADLMQNPPRRVSEEKLYAALRARLMFSECSDCADMPEDYGDKLRKAARKQNSYGDFFASLRARHITDARLRRMLLFALCGVTKEELSRLPTAALLLAVSSGGRTLLRERPAGASVSILPTLSHSRQADPYDRRRLCKQRDAERLFQSLLM